jgi:hypothetical protein
MAARRRPREPFFHTYSRNYIYLALNGMAAFLRICLTTFIIVDPLYSAMPEVFSKAKAIPNACSVSNSAFRDCSRPRPILLAEALNT